MPTDHPYPTHFCAAFYGSTMYGTLHIQTGVPFEAYEFLGSGVFFLLGLIPWLVGWLAGWLVGWLVGELVGWWVGGLVGWWVGGLVGCAGDAGDVASPAENQP